MDNISTMLQLCRLCLVKDNVNIPIFEEQGDISQIFQKISSCLPVKVSREDKLPQKICDGCSYKLDVVYDFRNTTVNAEKQLLTWLNEAQQGSAAAAARQVEQEVSQQIKPPETFVKQEEIDPSDVSKEEDDVKSYMFHDKFEEVPSESKPSENDDEPPPPKRAKRTAAVKAAIAIDDHESDEDDDDSGEPLTKVEDESDDGSEEDHTFVDIPSTSADDQPGPSGVGKDGGEAPIVSMSQKKLRKLIKKYAVRDCRVELKNVMTDRTLKFDGYTAILPVQPKRKYTCYECWEKFFYTHELSKHKLIHKKEEELKEAQREAERKKAKELKKRKEEMKQSKLINDHSAPAENKTSPNVESVDVDSCAYICVTCNTGLNTANEVKTHATAKCKFYCGKCKRTFNTTQGFTIHILQHKIKNINPIEEKKYTCLECCNVFFDIIQLRSHTLLKHSKKLEVDKKPEPVKISASKQEVKENSDDSNLTCELCFDVFTTKKEFDEHMDFHKQLTNGEGENSKNNEGESSKDNERRSSKDNEVQSNNDEKKLSESQNDVLKFPVIESSYSLADSLDNGIIPSEFEIVKPNDVIPQEHYKCKICFRMFMSMDEYNDHLQKKCTIFTKCTECPKNVKSNVHFFNHFSKTHNKIFICEYCFESVRGQKEVEHHKLSHFKTFKNVCKICFKVFKNYPAFNKHLNEHLNF